MNITVVQGVLRAEPQRHELRSGEDVVDYEVTVPASGVRPAESVPVRWPSPPVAAGRLRAGEEVVVVGRVRRRFFRAGGSTRSRTEVLAEVVVPARHAARARRAIEAAAGSLVGRT